MKRNLLTFIIALLGSMILSHNDAIAKDSYYNSSSLQKLLNGKTVRFNTGLVAVYKANKKYNASFKGENYPGKWRIKSNKICVNFDDGRSRCDQYVKDGNSIYFEDAGGGRYKVKSIK